MTHVIDRGLPVSTLESLLDRSVAAPRFTTVLLAALGGLSLLLATIGVYGLLAYSVAQRTREIGIRVALGAARGQLVAMVVGEGMRVAMAGVVVGLVAALYASRWLEKLLFEVPRNDPDKVLVDPPLKTKLIRPPSGMSFQASFAFHN